MISTIVYNKNKKIQKTEGIPFSQWNENAKEIIWIDIHNPTKEELELVLQKVFSFHALAIEDVKPKEREPNAETLHHPKIDDYGKYLFIIFHGIVENHAEKGSNNFFHTFQLSAFLGKNFLITIHYHPVTIIEELFHKCELNNLFLQRGPDYLMHIVLDGMVDYYSPVLDRIDENIDVLEDEIFSTPTNRTLSKIITAKRKISKLYRITASQREILLRLSRGEFPLISQQESFYYRNVYDHLVRIAELSESYRDSMSTILEAYLSIVSNRLNEVMKFLTIMGTIILPLTLVTGIYGMNFEFMPELHWRYGYVAVWFVMGIISVSLLLFFKKRKWM